MKRVELNEICDLQNGFAFKSSDYVDSSNTLNCRMSNIRPEGYFDVDYAPKYLPDDYVEKYKDYLLHDGDLVIAMTDMANDPKILGVPTIVDTGGKSMLLNQRVGKLEIIAPDLIHVPYLQYSLNRKSVKKYYTKFAGGGLQLNVGKKQILSVKIPLPPLDQQKKIAAILDAADEYRIKTKALIAKYDELTQSLFLDMFGDTYKNTNNLQEACLSELIDKDRGISYGVVQRGDHDENGVPLIRIRDIIANTFFESDVVKTDKANSDKYKRTILQGGEFLISIRGTVGKITIAPDHCKGWNITREVAIIPVIGNVNKTYLLHFLKSHGITTKILGDVKGVAQSGINLKDLRDLAIYLPEMQIQKQFAARVQAIEAQKAQAQESLAKAEELFNSLLQKAFKGELTKLVY